MILNRKFNFYTENVLSSQSSIGKEHIYSVGVNGIISRIPKKDICRILVKQKEKLKNVQV
jgi:hypothetical protein